MNNIWEIASETSNFFLEKNEFFIALKCVAFAQNKVPFNKITAVTENVPRLPRLTLKEEPQIKSEEKKMEVPCTVSPDEIVKFEEIYNNSKDNLNSISVNQLRVFFEANKVAKETVDIALDLIPTKSSLSLTKVEFVVMLKTVNLLKLGAKPSILPDELLRMLGKTKEDIVKPEKATFFSNFSIHQVEPNVVQVENKSNEMMDIIIKARQLSRKLDHKVAFAKMNLENLKEHKIKLTNRANLVNVNLGKTRMALQETRKRNNVEQDRIAKLNFEINNKLKEDLFKRNDHEVELRRTSSIVLETQRNFKNTTNLSIPSMPGILTESTPEKKLDDNNNVPFFNFPSLPNEKEYFVNNRGLYPEF